MINILYVLYLSPTVWENYIKAQIRTCLRRTDKQTELIFELLIFTNYTIRNKQFIAFICFESTAIITKKLLKSSKSETASDALTDEQSLSLEDIILSLGRASQTGLGKAISK